MTLEERIGRTINRLVVVEHVLALQMLEAADDMPPMNEAALNAGLRELIDEAFHDLKPIEDAPFAINSWEPDSDKQPEPDETGGARPAPPVAG